MENTQTLLFSLLGLAAAAWFVLSRLTGRIRKASDPANWPEEEVIKVNDPTFLRHVKENEWPPGVSVYDTLDRHRNSRSQTTKPVAYQVPINHVVPAENEYFVGKLVWMARPTHSKLLEKGEYKYKWHFAKKSRTWEIRIQGRFKKVPPGKMFTGIVLNDYDYSLPIHSTTRRMVALMLPLLEAAASKLHLAWGARGADANLPDAEMLCLVGNMSAIDQIIVSPAGEKPPPIDSQLEK